MGVKFVRINHRRWVFLAALAGLAVYASKTKMDADTDRLRQIEANAVNEAMVSALGVDPWRGTSIGTMTRQLAAAAKSPAEEQMTLMTAHSDTADSDDQSEASDEEPTVEEIASNGVASAEPLSDLHLTNFSVVDGGVQFDFELDSTNSVASTVEIFSTTNLTAGVWNHEISDPILAGVTNHTTFLSWPSALIPQAFYTYGWPTDSDGDGVIDLYELLVTGTDPNNADTDGDGLSDGREIAMGINPKNTDSDGDGLWDGDEVDRHRTNPLCSDTDSDGIDDKIEAGLGLNPLSSDTDGDGLVDGYEFEHGLNPLNVDTDDDGVSDGDEMSVGANPCIDEALSSVGDIGEDPLFEIVGTANIVPVTREAYTGEIVLSHDVSGVGFSVDWHSPMTYSISGCSFKPRVTGRYTFQLCADDEGDISIGNVHLTSTYPNVGQEKSGVFVAGQEYSIVGTLYNDGGPASLAFEKFGEYQSIQRAMMRPELAYDRVIYEDTYLSGENGVEKPKNSTITWYSVYAHGGALGAKLTVSTKNIGNLHIFGDDNSFPLEVEIPPRGSFAKRYVCEGNAPSESHNDTHFISTLHEYVSGETTSVTSKLTCIEVTIVADSDNVSRHVFGPREQVNLGVLPSGTNVHWTVADINLEGNDCAFNMPKRECYIDVLLNYDGLAHVASLQCIGPQNVVSFQSDLATVADWQQRLRDAGLSDDPPEECWCAMITHLRLLPIFVSFENLHFIEGEGPSCAPKGCFYALRDLLGSHDNDSGAFRADREVGIMNSCGTDLAGISGLPLSYSSAPGSFYYAIPQYWRYINGSETNELNLIKVERQRVNFYSNGLLEIEKYGCRQSRQVIYR